jgi:hypothetical protein
LPELDQAGEPVGFGQSRSLAQQEGIDIGSGDRVGGADAPRQQPDERPGATADFENGLAGLWRHHVDQSPEHRPVARHPRAILERGDAPQIRAAGRHDGEVLRQARDGRRPLRGGEKERQQDQCGPRALDLV